MSMAVYQMLPAIADKYAWERRSGHVEPAFGGRTRGDPARASARARRSGVGDRDFRALGPARLRAGPVAALMMTQHIVVAAAVTGFYDVAGEARRTGAISRLRTSVSEAHRGRVMSSQFMPQRLAGGVGTVLIGSLSEQNGLRAPILAAVALALAAWSVAFTKRNGISAAFRRPALTPMQP